MTMIDLYSFNCWCVLRKTALVINRGTTHVIVKEHSSLRVWKTRLYFCRSFAWIRILTWITELEKQRRNSLHNHLWRCRFFNLIWFRLLCVTTEIRSYALDVWQGVAMDSLGPCPTLLSPAGGPHLKRPYICFMGGPPAGRLASGRILFPWTPHAVRLWEMQSHDEWAENEGFPEKNCVSQEFDYRGHGCSADFDLDYSYLVVKSRAPGRRQTDRYFRQIYFQDQENSLHNWMTFLGS
jgi:hypothetical protein